MQLLNRGSAPVQNEQDDEQDIESAMIKFCKEPGTAKEIVEYFNLTMDIGKGYGYSINF